MALRTGRRPIAHDMLEARRTKNTLRVAAVYAGAAFVALQVADVVFPALGIPESLTRYIIIGAILAFPAVVVLAWALGGAREAIHGSEQPTEASRDPIPVSPQRVAIIPFETRGGEEYAYLRDGMVDLLSSKLCGEGEPTTCLRWSMS